MNRDIPEAKMKQIQGMVDRQVEVVEAIEARMAGPKVEEYLDIVKRAAATLAVLQFTYIEIDNSNFHSHFQEMEVAVIYYNVSYILALFPEQDNTKDRLKLMNTFRSDVTSIMLHSLAAAKD